MAEKPTYKDLELKVNQLEKTKSYLNNILSNSQDLICIAGMDGYFKFVSPAWEEILGYTQEELLSKPFLDFIHPDDHEINDEEVAKLSVGNLTIDFENRYIHRDGSIIHVSWKATPIPAEKIIYCIGRDITKQVQMAKEIEKYHDNLEVLIEKRTTELQKEISDRMQAEEAVRKSEARYRAVAEDSPVLLCRHQPNGEITYVNEAYCKYFEKTSEELVGSSFLSLIPEEDRAAVTANLSALTAESPTQSHEHHVIASDDSIRWQRWTNRALFDAQGQSTIYQSIGEDITERKQAEDALKYSKLQIESVFNNLDAAIYITDMDSHEILFMNNHMKVIFEKDLTGQICWKSIHDNQDGPCEFCTNDKLIDDDGKPTGPYIWELYNQKIYKWYELHDQAIPWADGKLVRMEIAFDVTERKQMEKVLQESEGKNKALQEATFEALFFSEKGACIETNNSAGKLFGYKPDEFIGIFGTDVIADEYKTIVKDKMISGYDKPYEAIAQRKDGSKFWAEFHGKMFEYQGKMIRVTSARDISERKQAEKEREKLHEEVLKAQKLESLGILAGGIAHDFNNLLYVVMGNISLAQDDLNFESEVSENLQAAEEACIKATTLSAQLITFSKGGDPVKRMMSIDNLLKDTVLSALNEFNLKSNISLADSIRQVNIDENQIKQAIRNIVVNAKEAMDDNGQLKVSCENFDIPQEGLLSLNQGKYVKISFEDHGCGIPKENMKKIFDPYFSTKDMGIAKGQGLGLTISYSIIEKHRGLITLESELKTGSTFYIYLPAAALIKEVDLQKSEKKLTVQKPSKPPAAGTGKILLMDDEKSIRTFLSKVINRLGYDVETCIEGKETIEIYKKAMKSKEPFDVVILDLTNKFGMGGQEAMQRILEIDPDARGIVITGYSDDPVVANFRAHGFSGFVTKPATKGELSKVISEVIPKDL